MFLKKQYRSMMFTLILLLLMTLAALIPPIASAATPWGYPAWQYRQEITVKSSEVPSDLTDFPFLISITHTGLRDEALANGDDILITASDGTTKISHEIEKFVKATGELVAWAKAPALSSSVDTVFFIYYGNHSALNQENVSGTWNSGYSLIHHMKDDPDSSNITDSTNNNNDGSKKAANEPVQLDGKIAKSQDFDGADDYINISDSVSLNPSNITVEAWIKPSVFDSNDMFITKGSSGAGVLDFDLRTVSGVPRFGFYNGTWYSLSAGSSLTLGQWHQVVGTYDGTTMKIYVDGSPAGSSVIGVPLPNSTADLRLGIYAWSSSYWFNGGIDEVRLSNSVQSADWITTDFSNQNNPGGFFQAMGAPEAKPPSTGINTGLLGIIAVLLMGTGGAILKSRFKLIS